MGKQTPEPDLSGGAMLLEDVLVNLRQLARMTSELKTEITTEYQRLKDGDPDAAQRKLGSLLKGDIDALIKLLMQQEYSLNEFDKSRTGRAGAVALDLEAARFEVGCRLDRLRDAAGS